jgi:hypothetical protein
MMDVATYSIYIALDDAGEMVLLGDAELVNQRWQVAVSHAGPALIDITAVSDLTFDPETPLTWAGTSPPTCCAWSVVAPAPPAVPPAPVQEIAINDANGQAMQIGCWLNIVNQSPIPLTIVNGVG